MLSFIALLVFIVVALLFITTTVCVYIAGHDFRFCSEPYIGLLVFQTSSAPVRWHDEPRSTVSFREKKNVKMGERRAGTKTKKNNTHT